MAAKGTTPHEDARWAAFAALGDPTWPRRWGWVVVLVLAFATLVEPFVDAMPDSHRVVVPIATAVMVGAWAVELSGARWPRLILIAAIVLPNLYLTVAGHTSTNYLFLSLLVAWVTTVGSRTEGPLALALSLAVVSVAAVLQLADGQSGLAAWTSWSTGLVAVWLMALVLRREASLVAELRLLAEDNARLQERASQTAVLEERQRLARELHDSVTQTLYGASLQAEAAVRALADGEVEPAAASLREIRDTTQDALGEMRSLLFELRPPLLEERGLAAALRARLQTVEARAGLVTDFDGAHDDERLPLEAEQELYRVAQEALNNVVKHAHAQHVRVRMAVSDGHALLEIADDGVGFDPLSDGEGFGLPGMRERAERLGGSLEVESSAGGGTRLRIEVPR